MKRLSWIIWVVGLQYDHKGVFIRGRGRGRGREDDVMMEAHIGVM